MLIFDEKEQPIIIDNIHTPTPTTHMWILDLDIMDFTLTELKVLEEIQCPTIRVQIKNFMFDLPANWNILVFDDETMQLDVVEISEAVGRNFTAFIHGPNLSTAYGEKIVAVDYLPTAINIAPSLNKHQMLCHPIAPSAWINVSPSDTYNKYLKNCVIGNLF